MTDLNHQELAKQGNPQAIASLLENQLRSAGISTTSTTANLSVNFLEIILEADGVPDQNRSVELIRSELASLQPESIRTVKVEGREKGQLAAAWMQEFSLDASTFSKLTFAGGLASSSALVPNKNRLAPAGDVEVKAATLVALENRLRTTLIIVGIVTGILAIAVAAFVNKNFNEATASTGNNLEETANVETAPDTFREAVNKAAKASELGRSAKSKDDWVSVADSWQEAVSLMRRVPPSSPHHEVAQTKVLEYQKYLVYAQESAATPPPAIASPAAERATSEKESGKKSNSKKSESEKETPKKANSKKADSEKENSKKVNSEKANSEKENSKKENSEKANSEK